MHGLVVPQCNHSPLCLLIESLMISGDTSTISCDETLHADLHRTQIFSDIRLYWHVRACVIMAATDKFQVGRLLCTGFVCPGKSRVLATPAFQP